MEARSDENKSAQKCQDAVIFLALRSGALVQVLWSALLWIDGSLADSRESGLTKARPQDAAWRPKNHQSKAR